MTPRKALPGGQEEAEIGMASPELPPELPATGAVSHRGMWPGLAMSSLKVFLKLFSPRFSMLALDVCIYDVGHPRRYKSKVLTFLLNVSGLAWEDPCYSWVLGPVSDIISLHRRFWERKYRKNFLEGFLCLLFGTVGELVVLSLVDEFPMLRLASDVALEGYLPVEIEFEDDRWILLIY
jgi:hypothetical protein